MVIPYRPSFRIEANGSDVTALFMDRFVDLSITDEAGTKSDSLSITLSDDGLRLPSEGGELRVWLGYEGGARLMGLYIVDEVEVSGPTPLMKIKALGAPLGRTAAFSALQASRSRSWLPCTVGDIVKTIAEEHGLKPAVSSAFAALALDHIDQTDESDMNLLTRIARDHDAIAKANGGALLFVERGRGKNAAGVNMPRVALTPKEVSRWSVKISKRAAYGSVIARWRDKDAAKDCEARAGDAEPIFRIKGPYPSEEAAKKAAKGRLEGFQRGQSTLSLSMPGRADLVAESRLVLFGFRTGVDGEWSVTRVTHSLKGQGFTTSVEAEMPKA